jgi:hypothetical protein
MKKILLILTFFIFVNLKINAQITNEEKNQIVWVKEVPTCPDDKNITKLINTIGIDELSKNKKTIDKDDVKIYREIGVAFNKKEKTNITKIDKYFDLLFILVTLAIIIIFYISFKLRYFKLEKLIVDKKNQELYEQIDDYVIIIKAINKKNIIIDKHRGELDRNRRGIIVLLYENGVYKQFLKNANCFSSENEDGGVYFQPELYISIEKGKLFFFNTRGSVRLFDVHKRQKKELV